MAKFNKEKVVNGLKATGEFVSSAGAQALACGIVRAILPPGVNVVVQGGVLLGGLLLGGFVGDKLADYTSEQIDTSVQYVEDTVSEVKRCLDVIQDKDLEKKTEGENVG